MMRPSFDLQQPRLIEDGGEIVVSPLGNATDGNLRAESARSEAISVSRQTLGGDSLRELPYPPNLGEGRPAQAHETNGEIQDDTFQ
jgi:hypothetical protein